MTRSRLGTNEGAPVQAFGWKSPGTNTPSVPAEGSTGVRCGAARRKWTITAPGPRERCLRHYAAPPDAVADILASHRHLRLSFAGRADPTRMPPRDGKNGARGRAVQPRAPIGPATSRSASLLTRALSACTATGRLPRLRWAPTFSAAMVALESVSAGMTPMITQRSASPTLPPCSPKLGPGRSVMVSGCIAGPGTSGRGDAGLVGTRKDADRYRRGIATPLWRLPFLLEALSWRRRRATSPPGTPSGPPPALPGRTNHCQRRPPSRRRWLARPLPRRIG